MAFGLIEVALVFAIVLGRLGYKLCSIRRTLRDDQKRAERTPK